MPFTTEQFFAVFVRYNTAVWPAPVLLYALALATLVLARHGGRWPALLLALLWTWTGLVYHWAFFTTINPAAWAFGALNLAGAAVFIRVAAHGGLRARPIGVRSWLGWAPIGYALLGYPLLGLALGHRFPATPTFGAPCPVTIFTLGVLLLCSAPRAAWIVPVIWAAIGSTAAFALAVPEDLGLLLAGSIGLWIGVVRPARPAASGVPGTVRASKRGSRT